MDPHPAPAASSDVEFRAMSGAKTTLLCVMLICVPAASAPGDLQAPIVTPPGVTQETVARALRLADRDAARCEFWMDVAEGLNDPASVYPQFVRDAQATQAEAMAEAEQRYANRQELHRLVGTARYAPIIDPDDFVADVTNPHFPLVPGLTRTYRARTAEGAPVRIDETILDSTVNILGVACRQLHIETWIDGERSEESTEWFAQHRDGSVWFFGLVEKRYEEGFLESLEGSWRAGKDGALPGVMMPGMPTVGATFRKEFAPREEAEDVITVCGRNETVVVGGRRYTGCVKIEEFSPLENEREFKYFAPGVGLILEVNPSTGERVEIVVN